MCFVTMSWAFVRFFFFQAEDGIRDVAVTGVQRVLFRSVRTVLASSVEEMPDPEVTGEVLVSGGQVATQSSPQLLEPFLSGMKPYSVRPHWSVRIWPYRESLILTVTAPDLPSGAAAAVGDAVTDPPVVPFASVDGALPPLQPAAVRLAVTNSAASAYLR